MTLSVIGLGVALDRQVAGQLVAVAAGELDLGALEGHRRELVDLEEVGRAKVLVALLVVGADARRLDRGLDLRLSRAGRGRSSPVAVDLGEVAAHGHHAEMLGRELDLGVKRIELPIAHAKTPLRRWTAAKDCNPCERATYSRSMSGQAERGCQRRSSGCPVLPNAMRSRTTGARPSSRERCIASSPKRSRIASTAASSRSLRGGVGVGEQVELTGVPVDEPRKPDAQRADAQSWIARGQQLAARPDRSRRRSAIGLGSVTCREKWPTSGPVDDADRHHAAAPARARAAGGRPCPTAA